ncbi:hypothetical protein J14TS2_15780 [Bacillus sp. J14TS2]|uniref:nucleotidyltransferase domain-containing protein n=1 Tax=Bacillus sp. J14TS2 TaxID=2807188 RepID=UPI001B11590E|nr:nucleotidyltransferase domain-containing protein [Bacillus sp. J14TS2]GIN71103.1 hypothetical protein J14TS2_15780 [Bacillus sp. J14TS2]
MNTSVEDLIQEFIEQEIPKRKALNVIILCGSYAVGKATERSDIDLCFIGDFSEFQRESHVYKKREFQLMISSWSWYEAVIQNYERKNNIDTITTMLAKGQCLWGESERWINLKKLAIKYYNMGPNPATKDEIRKLRVRITDLWNDYCASTEENNRNWLSFHIIQVCVEVHFIIRNWWGTKTKYQLEELEKRDPHMNSLVGNCLKAKGTKEDILYTLCNHVLNPIGGFMNESWSSRTESGKN